MLKTLGLIAFTVCICGVAPALQAATVVLSGSASGAITHSFGGDEFTSTTDTVHIAFTVPPSTRLKDYDTLVLTAAAAPGTSWLFTLPPGATSTSVRFFGLTDNGSGFAANALTNTMTFTYAQGSAANIVGNPFRQAILQPNGGMAINNANNYNATIAITSFTITVTYNPALITNDQPITGLSNANLTLAYNVATDPGTMFTIVPEPGVGSLLLVGCALAGRRRQRVEAGSR